MFGPGLNGAYESSLLNTTTVVGTGVLNFIFGKRRANTSRNCSSLSPTFLMSFSPALPTRVKFFVRTLTHESFATTGCCETARRRQRLSARGTIKRFIFLGSKDGGIGETEAVFNRHPLRYRLSALHCRFELDFARRANCVLRQSVRKPSHYSDAIDLPVARQ